MNNISTNIIKLPISIEDQPLFTAILPKITKSILENDILSSEDQKLVHKLFPDHTFYENNNLNIEKIKEDFFNYLF